MGSTARRQHYVSQFYLKHFASPMFSTSLNYFDLTSRDWQMRTPRGVAWEPHLFSTIGVDGVRNDWFDQFLKKRVEDPAAPALKKMAERVSLEEEEKRAVALFIAVTASRNPDLVSRSVSSYFRDLPRPQLAELKLAATQWCRARGVEYDQNTREEFFRPTSFGGMWLWAQNLSARIINWRWYTVRTSADRPFVTSDSPVSASRDDSGSFSLISFPISSERGLVIVEHGAFNIDRDLSCEATVLNHQTIEGASRFIVASRRDFPGAKTASVVTDA